MGSSKAVSALLGSGLRWQWRVVSWQRMGSQCWLLLQQSCSLSFFHLFSLKYIKTDLEKWNESMHPCHSQIKGFSLVCECFYVCCVFILEEWCTPLYSGEPDPQQCRVPLRQYKLCPEGLNIYSNEDCSEKTDSSLFESGARHDTFGFSVSDPHFVTVTDIKLLWEIVER